MIATVYDYGVHEGIPFTVFEYIPGETLRALLRRRGRLPLEEVRLIIAPIAQALDFAHSRHVVHRDLKPENIRATEQGSIQDPRPGPSQGVLSPRPWIGLGSAALPRTPHPNKPKDSPAMAVRISTPCP